MHRVALIDGDLAIRAGRRLMIDSQSNLQLVYEESDAQLALEKIPELLIDVLVIDHRLKGFDGLQLSKHLVDAFAEKGEICPTIIITGTYATPELVMSAIRCGASDVVTQDAPMAELLTAINNASNSKVFADFSSFDEVLNHSEYEPKPDPIFVLRRSQLGDDLKSILDCLDAGMSSSEVMASQKLSAEQFKIRMNRLLIALHLATFEQLYLALHDSKA
jgi:DNA-binding NarL/FixJ family response regulator